MEFELPTVEPQAFNAKPDVVWSDSLVMGLRFVYIEKQSGVALQTGRDAGSLHLLQAEDSFSPGKSVLAHRPLPSYPDRTVTSRTLGVLHSRSPFTHPSARARS